MASAATQRFGNEVFRFSPRQIHQYYDRIDLPAKYRYEPGEFSREVVRQRDGHGFLGALQRHTLAHIPFENLQLHYSSYHLSSMHPDALFDMTVLGGRGRGGYCMENNVLLGLVLRSLGFDAMSVGARINTQNQHDGQESGKASFSGWSHMINLVTIRGERYVVDVGFGAGGTSHPLPLKEGEVSMNTPPNQNIRLRKDHIAEADSEHAKMWIVERRTAEDGPWTPLYCFESHVCFLPQDFEIMSFYTSMNRTSFYTYRVICSKYIIDEQLETVIGDVVLYDDRVVRRVRGRAGQVVQLRTEKDRIEALDRYLGITLTEAEKSGIKGMVTELPDEEDLDD